MTKYVLSTLIGVALAAGPALAASLPSASATAAYSNLSALAKAAVAPAPSSASSADPDNPADANDTGWVTVLTTYAKTPNWKDLAFDVAMQCGLVTFTEVKSKGGAKDTSSASGTVRIRVKVTDEDGVVRYAQPNEGDDVDNGVTYCHRTQTLSATFQGIIENCIDPDTGTIAITDDCLLPEEVSLLLSTLSANAFNFVMADVVPGIHKIEVQARAQSTAELFDAQMGSASGEAFVGLGSMHVSTVRMIKGSDGSVIDLD